MKRIIFCVWVILFTAFFLSGCWSRTEPKNLSLVNSVIFDLKANGDIRIIKEMMKLPGNTGGKQSGGSQNTITLLNCEGKTAAEAVRDELNGKTLFGGNIKARLFSERFAKADMKPVLDYLLRDHLTDETPFMVVVKGDDPSLVYSSMPGISDMLGNYIEEMSKTETKIKNESVYKTTLDFIKEYDDEGREPVAGLIDVVDNELRPEGGSQAETQDITQRKYKILYSGLAAFKGNKLVGYMDAKETRAYNFVTGKVQGAIVTLPDNLTSGKVISAQSKIKTDIINGEATIYVDTKVSLSVIENGNNYTLNEVGPLKEVEQSFNKQLQAEITESIQKAQTQFQSDIFGFGDYVHIQHPKEWRNIKKYWDNTFTKAKVNVAIDSSVMMSGETKDRVIRKE